MAGPEGDGEYVVTSRSASPGTFSRVGSLVTAPPAGMVTAGLLPKDSRRMVPLAAVGLLGAAASARVAWLTTSGRVP